MHMCDDKHMYMCSAGDLYFDKAVGGFLRELFEHWQKEGCNHEVTLLFCWRAFYSKSTMGGSCDHCIMSCDYYMTSRGAVR